MDWDTLPVQAGCISIYIICASSICYFQRIPYIAGRFWLRRKKRLIKIYEDTSGNKQQKELFINTDGKNFNQTMIFQANKPRGESDRKIRRRRSPSLAPFDEIHKAYSDPYGARKHDKSHYFDMFNVEERRGDCTQSCANGAALTDADADSDDNSDDDNPDDDQETEAFG